MISGILEERLADAERVGSITQVAQIAQEAIGVLKKLEKENKKLKEKRVE